MPHEEIYDPRFVQALFDEMSGTYGLTNLIASFGFARRWRRQCVRQLDWSAGSHVIDLMSGMGELCPELARQIGPQGRITAVDLSPVMCAKARRYEQGGLRATVEIHETDALASDLPDASADVVISSFGLKTFSREQIERLAVEVHRLLKPGGRCAFVEISVPPAAWLRGAYLFYLSRVIPTIGWLMLGNPENYRLLGVYTRAFENCTAATAAFRRAGLATEPRSFFFGCATGFVGWKRDA